MMVIVRMDSSEVIIFGYICQQVCESHEKLRGFNQVCRYSLFQYED